MYRLDVLQGNLDAQSDCDQCLDSSSQQTILQSDYCFTIWLPAPGGSWANSSPGLEEGEAQSGQEGDGAGWRSFQAGSHMGVRRRHRHPHTLHHHTA